MQNIVAGKDNYDEAQFSQLNRENLKVNMLL